MKCNGHWNHLPDLGMDVCYDKDLQAQFLFISTCTDTGVIATHALSFYRPLAPLFLLTHAQLAVVTQSCALLYITAHCDLLLQWRYCSCDAYYARYSIVLIEYLVRLAG